MERDENYSYSKPECFPAPENFSGIDYNLMKPSGGETSGDSHGGGMVDYMLNNSQQQQINSAFCNSSFGNVMQFADFGPKLGLNPSKISDEEGGIDPVYFLKFPVLNGNDESEARDMEEEDEEARVSKNMTPMHIGFMGENARKGVNNAEAKNKRKRPRTIKTSQEVESQRMTHIAVERNRRKQMNEHLRVLRSLMPGSYVQRGDQASIIGGAIEFVRELEQLLQCLESQKRRRLFGDPPRPTGDSPLPIQQPQSPFFPPLPLTNDQINFETGLQEETAEKKSCLADVEVKLLGFDGMIKILSRRRPGQLIKTIAALEDLQLNILHTNITTIEQTVLYSFNIKITSESRFTAEDIANSVQQIFSFIHANSCI